MFNLNESIPAHLRARYHVETWKTFSTDETTITIEAYQNALGTYEYAVTYDGVVVSLLRDMHIALTVFHAYRFNDLHALSQKSRKETSSTYSQFLEDTVNDSEYNAWLDHTNTPRADFY